jgi:DNA-binding XRE family transcriptional regulator
MTFAERLRQLRRRADLTQEQLAQGSGINVWTIRGYEQGRREPNWKGAIALAGALGTSVEEAFAGCAETSPEGPQDGQPPGGKGPKGKGPPAARARKK